MGVLDKRIQATVSQGLKPIEKALMEQQEKNIEHNRNLMKMKMDEIHKDLERIVEEKVKEALEKK